MPELAVGGFVFLNGPGRQKVQDEVVYEVAFSANVSAKLVEGGDYHLEWAGQFCAVSVASVQVGKKVGMVAFDSIRFCAVS